MVSEKSAKGKYTIKELLETRKAGFDVVDPIGLADEVSAALASNQISIEDALQLADYRNQDSADE